MPAVGRAKVFEPICLLPAIFSAVEKGFFRDLDAHA